MSDASYFCDGCTFAEWQRTSNGRLHPTKQGRCTRLEAYPLKLDLPAAFYWPGYEGAAPKPSGGLIMRGGSYKTPCKFKTRAKP